MTKIHECYTCNLLSRVGPCFGHDIDDLAAASAAEENNNAKRIGPYMVKALLTFMRAVREKVRAARLDQQQGGQRGEL